MERKTKISLLLKKAQNLENEDRDGSYMSVTSLRALVEHCSELLEKIDNNSDLDDWVESKINGAARDILDVYEFMMHSKRD
jgi:hypothetical protein